MHEAGAVEQYVEWPVCLDQCGNRGSVGDVEQVRRDGIRFGGQRLQRSGVDVGGNHLCTGACAGQCTFAPDAGAGGGNQAALALQAGVGCGEDRDSHSDEVP